MLMLMTSITRSPAFNFSREKVNFAAFIQDIFMFGCLCIPKGIYMINNSPSG